VPMGFMKESTGLTPGYCNKLWVQFLFVTH